MHALYLSHDEVCESCWYVGDRVMPSHIRVTGDIIRESLDLPLCLTAPAKYEIEIMYRDGRSPDPSCDTTVTSRRGAGCQRKKAGSLRRHSGTCSLLVAWLFQRSCRSVHGF